MKTELLLNLESAVSDRNPFAARNLLPGLDSKRIRKLLDRGRVEGDHEILVSLFSWRNGSERSGRPLAETSLFPYSTLQFLTIDAAIEHFKGFSVAAEAVRGVGSFYDKLLDGAMRYFPLFWDEGHGYLALDIKLKSPGRVLYVEFESDDPFHQAYASLEEFLVDAIRANVEGKPLRCFSPTSKQTD